MYAPGAPDSGIFARFVGGSGGKHLLRPGASLELRVESLADGTAILVHRSGLRIAVPAPSGLEAGQTIHVAVLALSPSLRLRRIVPTVTALGATVSTGTTAEDATLPAGRTLIDRFLDAYRLAETPGARDLVRAFVASHRHLVPESVHRVAALFALLARRFHDESLRSRRRAALARASVELHDRSIKISDPATAAEIDLAAWLVDGPGRGPGDGDNRRRESRARGTAGDLSAYLSRATHTPDHPLQLFNTLATTGDLHWIVIPIGATSGRGPSEARVEGTLKLALSRSAGAVEGARLTVTRGDRRWCFAWRFDDGRPVLSRATGDGGASPIPEALLARLGVTRHTDRVTSEGDDGFTIGMIEDGHEGVDQYG